MKYSELQVGDLWFSDYATHITPHLVLKIKSCRRARHAWITVWYCDERNNFITAAYPLDETIPCLLHVLRDGARLV
jgi:hypothetical protein